MIISIEVYIYTAEYPTVYHLPSTPDIVIYSIEAQLGNQLHVDYIEGVQGNPLIVLLASCLCLQQDSRTEPADEWEPLEAA